MAKNDSLNQGVGTERENDLVNKACMKRSKINPRTYRQVKYYLRKRKDGLFVIDKRMVRKEHGNTWIKQEYKKQLKTVA